MRINSDRIEGMRVVKGLEKVLAGLMLFHIIMYLIQLGLIGAHVVSLTRECIEMRCINVSKLLFTFVMIFVLFPFAGLNS